MIGTKIKNWDRSNFLFRKLDLSLVFNRHYHIL